MTRQVGRLTTLGWIDRTSDPADARATLVAITDIGREALADARRARGEAVDRLLEETGASADRVRDAAELLDQLLQAARGATGEE